jgi:hypothetical protein
MNARSPARDDDARSRIRPLFKKSPGPRPDRKAPANKLLNRINKGSRCACQEQNGAASQRDLAEDAFLSLNTRGKIAETVMSWGVF